MSIFTTHHNIVDEYKTYIESFINIKKEHIRNAVEEALETGKLWPDPLIQFNPSYKVGESVPNMISKGELHPEINHVFQGYNLYEHQVEAIRIGTAGQGFIVTSGTGSGKSLTFLGTIFNNLFDNKGDKGVKAVLIYPMNALINSQTQEIQKYADNYQEATGKDFPFSFAQYTGQESQEVRERIKADPPDILLTNYMMLELILTRHGDRDLKDSIYKNLRYLVYDELHTFRGRQGSDVAILNRRLKALCTNPITCMGTSATMVSGGTILDQKQEVAKVASTFFGTSFSAEQIVVESLEPSLSIIPVQKADLVRTVAEGVDIEADRTSLMKDPLAQWLEQSVALKKATDGIIIRDKPKTLEEIIQELNAATDLPEEQCKSALLTELEWISRVNVKASKQGLRSILPYKLHQFISQTGSVYATLDQEPSLQKITLESGIYDPTEDDKMIYPIVFSRETGQEFYCVTLDAANERVLPREFSEVPLGDEEEPADWGTVGYLIPDSEAWDEERLEDVPTSWVNRRKDGSLSVKKKFRDRMPQRIWFKADGSYSFDPPLDIGTWHEGWYMGYKLLFDPTSMTFYSAQTKDRTKLTTLGSEGRATSTTILTFNTLKQLAAAKYPYEKQKVLSFTDNRQDAALQAGHFNDFISTVRIRAAIYQALKQTASGRLSYDEIGEAVAKALQLPIEEYAENPVQFGRMKRENEEALIDFLMYRILYDLRRSWRVILPNLEQCGLLSIEYKDIEETCKEPAFFNNIDWFASLSEQDRIDLVRRSLEFFRREYAISARSYLTEEQIKRKRLNIEQRLKAPWRFEEEEKITLPNYLRYEQLDQRSKGFSVSVGHISAYGKYLRDLMKQLDLGPETAKIGRDDYPVFIEEWLNLLAQAGWLLKEERQTQEGQKTYVYQLDIAALEWTLTDQQEVEIDPIKMRAKQAYKKPANKYFRRIYSSHFDSAVKLEARDHTGQISNEDRQDREERFKSGELSALFCSPTMELGIDISSLDVVHMRNVPPNPASYAQRSGRAGRSGQAALVFTFCSAFSPHDRNYFNNILGMVSGEVVAPRLDLVNKELLQSHLQAMGLAQLGLSGLNEGMRKLVDTSRAEYPFNADVNELLISRMGPAQKSRLAGQFHQVVEDIREELEQGKGKTWYNSNWIEETLERFPTEFDRALDRWRKLYRTANEQLHEASDEIKTGLYKRSSKEYKSLTFQQSRAQRQIDLLLNETGAFSGLSEFYPYRYLASAGFLPGYNFTRLPIRTFLQNRDIGEYLSRPRFIALREYGPLNVIYHGGNKFRIQRLILPGNLQVTKAKVSNVSGYFMEGDDYQRDTCPLTGVNLKEGAGETLYTELLEMTETQGEVAERISCDEEERLSQGFDIKTYFSVPGGVERIERAEVKNQGKHLLSLQYIPAARLIQINEKWRRNVEAKFPIGEESGIFHKHGYQPKEDKEQVQRIQLFTWDTADALYIQPIQALGLDKVGRLSLMYALKRAIELEFQVESSEIGVEQMGTNDSPNLMIYENAEGSLGILAQIVHHPATFQRLIEKAIDLCRFDDPEYKAPASYDDLLSYYNQRYHSEVDRFAIQQPLELLRNCKVEPSQTHEANYDYEQHYRDLIAAYDKNSSTERVFLDFLFQNKLRLPDRAQDRHKDLYVQPDFVYETNGVRTWIFCDGTPHDDPDIQERDRRQRRAIRKTGDEYWVFYYKDDLAETTKQRPDLFKQMQ
jgi:superfamily II DNA/RNA helicase